MPWDPQQYDLFQAARARPGYDLMAALPSMAPGRIVDLGCGTGGHARALAARWPDAAVSGVDSSAAMLAKAAQTPSPVSWTLGDIAQWQPPEPVGLIFSNAALHWLPEHDTLFPRLLDALAPGGVLAVQMPRNFGARSHTVLRGVATDGSWAPKLVSVLREEPVLAPEAYWRILAPRAAAVDLWETEYLHVLDGPDPVLEWTKGTALVPVLERLDGEERQAFLAEYAARLRRAYPPEPDGRTLFPFRRLFLIARATG